MENRRLRLSDLMILVVAVAAGAAWTRALGIFDDWIFIVPHDARTTLGAVIGLMFLLCPILSTLTITTLLLRLRPPRPKRSRLTRQPGFVVCSAATIGLLASGLLVVSVSAFLPPQWFLHPRRGLLEMWAFLWSFIGSATGGALACLTLCVGWRPEPSWIDRTGRVLGLLWIIFALCTVIRFATGF